MNRVISLAVKPDCLNILIDLRSSRYEAIARSPHRINKLKTKLEKSIIFNGIYAREKKVRNIQTRLEVLFQSDRANCRDALYPYFGGGDTDAATYDKFSAE